MAPELSTEAIGRLVEAMLRRGYPVIGEISVLLGVSPRTLQRRLNQQGASYSDLVERCRHQAACEYLEHTSDSIADIARKLGYCDASSFSRAFRRWTGRTPRSWRQQLFPQMNSPANQRLGT